MITNVLLSAKTLHDSIVAELLGKLYVAEKNSRRHRTNVAIV